MQNSNFKISEKALLSIKDKINAISSLSIFSTDKSYEMDSTAKKELLSSGVFDKNGSPSKKAKPVLSILASTKHLVSIQIPTTGNDPIDLSLYYDKNGNSTALTKNSNDLTISHPAPTEDICILISQITGKTSLQISNFKKEFSINTWIVLAGIIDALRSEYFFCFSSNETFKNVGLNIEQLSTIINSDLQYAWFSNILKTRFSIKNLDNSNINRALTELTDKNIIRENRKYYIISDEEILNFALDILHLENIVNISTAFESPENKIYKAGFIALQTGVNSCFFIEGNPENNSISIESISTELLINYVKQGIENPDNIINAENIVQREKEFQSSEKSKTSQNSDIEKEITTEENRFCGKCGSPLKPGDTFCGSCGNKIS